MTCSVSNTCLQAASLDYRGCGRGGRASYKASTGVGTGRR